MRLMVLVVKMLIYLSPILISQLSKKSPRMIVVSLISMLKIANSSENWLTSVDVAEKDEVVGRSATESVFD